MISILKKSKSFFRIIFKLTYFMRRYVIRKRYFGFITRISTQSDDILKNIINDIDRDIDEREKLRIKLAFTFSDSNVGMFASGRMAFYSVLKSLDMSKDSEVILTGFTCSVMVNAVLKSGAKPVFADIDPNTFGSSSASIMSKITSKTKVIVAQHSFGIPCEIDKIANLCRENNIFLMEDCAISFLSSYKDRTLGLWGDAAIFSMDHSKPISTLIGGFVITRNKNLFLRIKEIEDSALDLSLQHQLKLCKRLHLEYKYATPLKYNGLKFWDLFSNFTKRNINLFLDKDNTSCNLINNSYYPYPAKYPLLLSRIGLIEIDSYIDNISKTKEIFKYTIERLQNKGIALPSCYSNADSSIIPLRIVFNYHDKMIAYKLSKIVDSSWFWFKKPIVATKDSLESFGYQSGTCPIAESVSKTIVNIPFLGLSVRDIDSIIDNI